MVLFAAGGNAQESAIETAVKATYLYKFPPFIEWPPDALASLTTFTLCLAGNDPFGSVLDRAVSGQQIKGRPIIVRRVAPVATDAGCQLIYFAGPAPQVAAALAGLRGKPVVTVTDGARDTRSKGILNFVIVDNRVRFEIDAAAATGAGLSISSKLMSLASNGRSGS